MATYKTKKISIPTENDEIGYRFTIKRMKDESSYSFKERLIHQSRADISHKTKDVGFYLNNSLGFLESAIFKIDRYKNVQGEDLYPYSYFRIDSKYFRIIKNFHTEEEIKIEYRGFDTYQDLMNEINSHSILECSSLHNIDINIIGDVYSLKKQTNEKVTSGIFTRSRFENLEDIENILIFEVANKLFFENQCNSPDEIDQGGDYYIDYKEGKVWNYSEMGSTYTCMHVEFPFYVKKQPVKINLGIDEGFEDLTKFEVEEAVGIKKKIGLTREGILFYRELFKSAPSYWGV